MGAPVGNRNAAGNRGGMRATKMFKKASSKAKRKSIMDKLKGRKSLTETQKKYQFIKRMNKLSKGKKNYYK